MGDSNENIFNLRAVDADSLVGTIVEYLFNQGDGSKVSSTGRRYDEEGISFKTESGELGGCLNLFYFRKGDIMVELKLEPVGEYVREGLSQLIGEISEEQ